MRDNLRTRATLDWNPSKQNGMLPALDGATYPQGNFDIIDRRPNYTAAVSADWVATAKLYVGARAGYFTSNHTDGERDGAAALSCSCGPTSGCWTCPRRFNTSVGSRRICRMT